MRAVTLLVLILLPMLAACAERLSDLENKVRSTDPRNEQLLFSLTGKSGETITLDITDITGTESSLDFFRLFWHTAHHLNDQGLGETQLNLASFGEIRLVVPANVVSDYGAAYPQENPVYLLRTFPAQVLLPNGETPFPERRGGLIAATTAQMEDFGSLSHIWILGPYMEQQDELNEIEFRDDEAF